MASAFWENSVSPRVSETMIAPQVPPCVRWLSASATAVASASLPTVADHAGLAGFFAVVVDRFGFLVVVGAVVIAASDDEDTPPACIAVAGAVLATSTPAASASRLTTISGPPALSILPTRESNIRL